MFFDMCVHAHDEHEEFDASNFPRAAPA